MNVGKCVLKAFWECKKLTMNKNALKMIMIEATAAVKDKPDETADSDTDSSEEEAEPPMEKKVPESIGVTPEKPKERSLSIRKDFRNKSVSQASLRDENAMRTTTNFKSSKPLISLQTIGQSGQLKCECGICEQCTGRSRTSFKVTKDLPQRKPPRISIISAPNGNKANATYYNGFKIDPKVTNDGQFGKPPLSNQFPIQPYAVPSHVASKD